MLLMYDKRYKKFLKFHSDLIFIGILSLLYGFIFLKRVVYPDLSFDTINYHFFLGKSGFFNFPYFFKSSEFYPLGMHSLNPIVDMMGYASYSILGYRLGTILSALSIIGTSVLGIFILRDILRNYLERKELFIVYLVLIAPVFIINEALFQVATYCTDNIYAFLLMLYLFLFLKFINLKKEKNYIQYVLVLGFLGGLIITKLTNFIYIAPFLLVTVYFVYKKVFCGSEKSYKKFLATIFIFGIPLFIVNYFLVINFLKSGNPFFPYYNGIFKSIYYPLKSWAFNFGPVTLNQRIFYPFYAIRDPAFLGEIKEMFPDVKILVIFFYVIISYLFLISKKIKFNRDEKVFLLIYFFTFFLWQIQFGYSRYGIFLEILGGMVSILLAFKIFISEKFIHPIKIFTVLFIFFMIFQSIKIVIFNYQYDVSWRPTTSYREWSDSFFSKKIFKKYTTINGKTSKDLEDVDVILQCVNPSTLYFSTIKKLENLPMLDIDRVLSRDLNNNKEYVSMRDQVISTSLNKKSLNFAIVFSDSEAIMKGTSREVCLSAIKEENSGGEKIRITKEINVDNFMADKNFKLKILLGSYTINNQ